MLRKACNENRTTMNSFLFSSRIYFPLISENIDAPHVFLRYLLDNFEIPKFSKGYNSGKKNDGIRSKVYQVILIIPFQLTKFQVPSFARYLEDKFSF